MDNTFMVCALHQRTVPLPRQLPALSGCFAGTREHGDCYMRDAQGAQRRQMPLV